MNSHPGKRWKTGAVSLNSTDIKNIRQFGTVAFVFFGCLCALGIWSKKPARNSKNRASKSLQVSVADSSLSLRVRQFRVGLEGLGEGGDCLAPLLNKEGLGEVRLE